MNITEKKIEFKMFDNYRVTHHLGSELIEIQVLRRKKSWFPPYCIALVSDCLLHKSK